PALARPGVPALPLEHPAEVLAVAGHEPHGKSLLGERGASLLLLDPVDDDFREGLREVERGGDFRNRAPLAVAVEAMEADAAGVVHEEGGFAVVVPGRVLINPRTREEDLCVVSTGGVARNAEAVGVGRNPVG